MRIGATVVVVAAALATSPPVSAAPVPDAATDAPAYARQTLTWTKCFPTPLPPGFPPGADRLECATMRAPLNWRAPAADRHIEIAVSRLRPAQGTPRGSLLINPGGPGAPGVIMPLVLLNRPAVAEAYELVGFDVRGTGASTNTTCGDMGPSSNDPRDRSRANLDLMFAAMDVAVRHCLHRGGALRQYVNTEQTVRDLDLLRHLLGRQKISWVGYSGGTWMGAYYATFFPRRVDRFVLDSNLDFTGTWQDAVLRQPLGFERRFREDFAPWAATYDERFHLGGTAEAVRVFYERLRADLNRDPIDAGDFTLDGYLLDAIVAQSMYRKLDFQPLAELLGELRAEVGGKGPIRLDPQTAAAVARARRTLPGLLPVDAADAFPATNAAVVCQDTPFNQSRSFWERESARQGRQYPLIGWSLAVVPCLVYPRPDLRLPTPTGRGVPPVLMVQSVRDAPTPLEGAQRAHRNFAGSHMLTVTNEGDHGIYVGVNPCADAIVDRFLLTGELPPRDSTCAGTGIPAPVDAQPAETHPLLLAERYNEAAQR